MAGPILTAPLAEFLDGDSDQWPKGSNGGTPVWQLTRDLVNRGHRVSVVTLDSSVTTPIIARGASLEVGYGPRRDRHRMRDLMRVERHAVRDGITRGRPDLVHAHWCYEYALGALASGTPTLITVRDWIPAILRLTEARYWPYWSGRALLYFATLARARHLSANSPYTADKVRPFTRAAVEVVPNGMPDEDFLPPGDRQSSLASAAGRRPVVLSVNNGFGPRKNVETLLMAHGLLKRRGVELRLQLIGGGYGPGGPCEVWARGRGLAEGVAFVGSLDRAEVLRRLRSASVLVHPAREESFGMTLIEAMSQHVPVIAGASSGAVPWVLDDGNAGLLVDVNDPRALGGALEAVLTQTTLQSKLAAAGYARAWGQFRQSHVTDLYVDLYRRVLAEVRCD